MSSQKRVLIIEDDLSQEEILFRLLRVVSPEVEVNWFTSAEMALAHMDVCGRTDAMKYDLVLADIFLDGRTSGIEFWEICRKLWAKTPIVLMSSMPMDEVFRIIGCESISPPFLSKPFSVGECVPMIGTLLTYGGRKRPGAAAA